jgi:hypothetical protein
VWAETKKSQKEEGRMKKLNQAPLTAFISGITS